MLLIDSYPLELALPDADEAALLVVNGIRSSWESNVTVNGVIRGGTDADDSISVDVLRKPKRRCRRLGRGVTGGAGGRGSGVECVG